MDYQQTNTTRIPPKNYMALSIIATILGCCTCTAYGLGFIFGLLGIYFASQVNSRFYSGDIYGAEKNAKYAKIFSLVAIGLVVIGLSYSAYVYLAHPEIYIEQKEIIEEAMRKYGLETQ